MEARVTSSSFAYIFLVTSLIQSTKDAQIASDPLVVPGGGKEHNPTVSTHKNIGTSSAAHEEPHSQLPSTKRASFTSRGHVYYLLQIMVV